MKGNGYKVEWLKNCMTAVHYRESMVGIIKMCVLEAWYGRLHSKKICFKNVFIISTYTPYMCTLACIGVFYVCCCVCMRHLTAMCYWAFIALWSLLTVHISLFASLIVKYTVLLSDYCFYLFIYLSFLHELGIIICTRMIDYNALEFVSWHFVSKDWKM